MVEKLINFAFGMMLLFIMRYIPCINNNRACLDLSRFNSEKKAASDIPQFEVESIADCFLSAMHKYFASDKGKQEFEDWKAGYITNKVK